MPGKLKSTVHETDGLSYSSDDELSTLGAALGASFEAALVYRERGSHDSGLASSSATSITSSSGSSPSNSTPSPELRHEANVESGHGAAAPHLGSAAVRQAPETPRRSQGLGGGRRHSHPYGGHRHQDPPDIRAQRRAAIRAGQQRNRIERQQVHLMSEIILENQGNYADHPELIVAAQDLRDSDNYIRRPNIFNTTAEEMAEAVARRARMTTLDERGMLLREARTNPVVQQQIPNPQPSNPNIGDPIDHFLDGPAR